MMLSSMIVFIAVALGLLTPALSAPTALQRATAADCADVMVIFARGTTEPPPIGLIVGPPLQSALQDQLGDRSLSFQGVDYPADIPGFLVGGSPQGSQTMANDITDAANSCPNAKIVSAGYSQGGQLVHNSAKLLTLDVQSRISAAVIFGDPDFGDPVAGVSADRTKVICHIGDDICAHGDLILPPHLTYGVDTPAAAQFIVSKVA
ncbi:cutA, cutinase A [Dendrothele bispora CBS 962.96]|uniref:cutinase n=1 Tax=Dendrothele bispora (strain CBS 962.96) TaxID=1314807 RepID=A0A4S8MYK8_DENBC|nr:cutA, cutinase A [Dendrothele bispora CBS 962.96]